MAYGRGGAGNIQAVAEQIAASKADLEANNLPAINSYPSATAHAARDEAQYAHSGRGGAGNYYSPKDLAARGEFAGAGSSHILGDGTPAPAASTAAKQVPSAVKASGRGGAGNFLFGIGESEAQAAAKREEDERRASALKEDIAKVVEEALPMPEKAKLPASEPFELV
nr:hypothetical protein CFP56_11556 [Quercus suber]